MKIISRYIFWQAANAVLLILLSLSGIVWIALALRQLNVVTSQGQDAWMLLRMTTLAVPNLMAVIAPFALLIAAMHVLNRLNGDSELIVLTAGGAPPTTVARPLILLALIVAAGVALVNHYVMPASLRLLREYVMEVRTDLLTQVIQPGRFTSPEKDLTFHIRERAATGDLLGLVMHDGRDEKQTQSYLANRALIVKQPESAYLVMLDGHILRRTSLDQPAQIIAFDKYAVDLDRFEPKDTEDSALKPRERYFSELVVRDEKSRGFKRIKGQIRAELHERFASPLYPIAFVLIALAAAGRARSNRQTRLRSLVAGYAVATGGRIAGMAANNLVVVSPEALALLYVIPVALGVGAIWHMRGGGGSRGFFRSRSPSWRSGGALAGARGT